MIARRISLFTGLYLFAFVFAHLVNLALGLDSVETMDRTRTWIISPWTNPIGGGLLAICLVFHICLGLRSLYLRNTLRLSAFDAFQLLLGLSIPLLLFPHMITLAMVPQLTGQHSTYEQVLAHFWIDNPWLGLRQVIGLMVVWLHSCMGLFIWMRLQGWWSRVSLFVYPTVVLLPTLAMLGFVEAGKEVIAEREATQSSYQSSASGDYGYESSTQSSTTGGSYRSNSVSDYGASSSSYGDAYSSTGGSETVPGTTDDSPADSNKQEAASTLTAAGPMQVIGRTVSMAVYGYLLLLALVLVARAIRVYPSRGTAIVRIGGAENVSSPSGATLLEISRLNDVPHASLCGGKGRCGTCQVAIVAGAENLTATTEIENRKLRQINAAENIRLACQARVTGGRIDIEPVLPGYVVADDMPHRRASPVAGAEPKVPISDMHREPVSVSDDQS